MATSDRRAAINNAADALRGLRMALTTTFVSRTHLTWPIISYCQRRDYLDWLVSGIGQAAIRAWLPLVAAARLAEDVPAERERLLAIVNR